MYYYYLNNIKLKYIIHFFSVFDIINSINFFYTSQVKDVNDMYFSCFYYD